MFALFDALARQRVPGPPEPAEVDDEDQPGHVMFSFEEFLEEHGAAAVFMVTRFTELEFRELYELLEEPLRPRGRGRRGMDVKSRLFVVLAWLTSGLTYARLGNELGIPRSIVADVVYHTVQVIKDPLVAAFFPKHSSDPEASCSMRFEDYPQAYGAVDASVVRIWRPRVDQQLYYSLKHKCHCVKVQALVAPDGICMHVSAVYKGSVHDKKLFDVSNVADFLTVEGRHRQFLADSGYQGLQRSIPEVILPFKKPRNDELTEEQKEHNRTLSRNRIIVENFFGRWKELFGIVHVVFRAESDFLKMVIPVTIALTNFHVRKHPLSRSADAPDSSDASDEEGDQMINLLLVG
jgi:hypothetical protein